jgi:hypothetical protein
VGGKGVSTDTKILEDIRDWITDVSSSVSSLESYLMEIEKKLSKVVDGLDTVARAVKNLR